MKLRKIKKLLIRNFNSVETKKCADEAKEKIADKDF